MSSQETVWQRFVLGRAHTHAQVNLDTIGRQKNVTVRADESLLNGAHVAECRQLYHEGRIVDHLRTIAATTTTTAVCSVVVVVSTM